MKTQVIAALVALAAQLQSAAAVPAAADYWDYLVRREPQTVASVIGNATKTGALKGFSIAYDPTLNTQSCRNFATEFAFLAKQGVGTIRVFDVGCNLADVVDAASANNIDLMLGVNEISADNFPKNLNKLISDVQSSKTGFATVKSIYIGNECVERGAAPQSVANAVSAARGILSTTAYTGKVITVDTFGKIKDNPVICSTSDFCGANIHAYFNNQCPSSNAGQFVFDSLKLTKDALPGKEILVTESGWPHAGLPNGAAGVSPLDQQKAIGSIMTKFADTPSDVFLFQPFDASYKAPGFNGVEPFFGIFSDALTSNTLVVV